MSSRIFALLATVLLCAGCQKSRPPSSPSATPQTSQAASPAASATVPADPAAVATLLGRPVHRSDCLSRSDGIGSPEVGIQRLILMALMDDFCRREVAALTQDEIDAFWQTLQSAAERSSGKKPPVGEFDEAKIQAQLDETREKLANKDAPWLERLQLEGQERSLTFALEHKTLAAHEAYNQLMPLRCQKALYEKYGGKVVGMQISIEPVGAYQKLIEDAETSGQLTFHDPTLEQSFRNRMNEYAQRTEVPPEFVDFSLPAWLQISLRRPAPTGTTPAGQPLGTATTTNQNNAATKPNDPDLTRRLEKPTELEALAQYVGDWTSDVTSKQAVWTPKEVKYRTSNHAEFVLTGRYLQHIEVNHIVGEPEKVTKAIWFQTFDAASSKYVTWFFQSTGIIAHLTGTWDAATQSFHYTDVEPPPDTTNKFSERSRDAATIDGSLVFSGNDGRKMFDMVWTRKRQAGVAGKPLAEQWSEIGTPIEPIPDEMKKLDLFIGQKDVEFIHRPSVLVPQGSTAKGTASGQWILDGRFLLGQTTLPNFQSMWVMGYDTNKKAFRYVLFGSNGRIEENIGQWNEAERVFDWKQVNGPPDLTRTSTTRRLDNGTVESHIIANTQDGKTHVDLTIKATRRK